MIAAAIDVCLPKRISEKAYAAFIENPPGSVLLGSHQTTLSNLTTPAVDIPHPSEIPMETHINSKLAVFNWHKALRAKPSAYAVSRGECADGVKTMLIAGGIPVPHHGEYYPPMARSYGPILPEIGFRAIMSEDGSTFDIASVRKRIAHIYGPNALIVVIGYHKKNPQAPGHMFLDDPNDNDYSDFRQGIDSTGTISPQELNFQVFAYTGPVVAGNNDKMLTVASIHPDEHDALKGKSFHRAASQLIGQHEPFRATSKVTATSADSGSANQTLTLP